MANVPACIAAHLKADSTLTALVAAASISVDPKEGTLPQIYIVAMGGEEIGPAQERPRISIWVEAATANACWQVHDRIRQLFHDKTNYTLGASAHQVRCTISARASTPIVEKDQDNGFWEGQAFYTFQVNAAHGF